MVNVELIKQYLPEHVWTIVSDFEIDDSYIMDIPDLIVLILESRSIDTIEEKQNWFNLFSMMTSDQIEKLRAILIKEKTRLAEIEAKYADKKKEIKNKYLKKREDMWYTKKIETIKAQEQETTNQEHEEADSLLANL
jgi:hypothetical protein